MLALSDHDTVAGVAEANAAAARAGIVNVAATELSAIDPDHVDVHILGYLIDPEDAAFGQRLVRFRADRLGRADRMIERLRSNGFELDMTEIDRRRLHREPLGRPHLARAVLYHPANAPRLEAEGLSTLSAVLEAYLLEGRPGFVARTTPTVPEAIEAIHDAGGIAIWAHPFWDVEAKADVLATLDRFVAAGLDGVEAFYPTHTPEQTRLLSDRASELRLLTTGSTDFHGPGNGLFDHFRGFKLHGRQPNLGPIGAL